MSGLELVAAALAVIGRLAQQEQKADRECDDDKDDDEAAAATVRSVAAFGAR